MIVRINYREQFSRVVGYVMKADKSPELVGGNLSAKDANGMIGEFGLLAALNTRCKKPVAHLSFSLSHGEHLDASQWADFAGRVAAEYGFEQYVAIRHHDTDCEHIHVVGNRIKLDGKAVATSNDRHRMRAICQQAERDFDLVKTAVRSPNIRINKDELECSQRLYRQGKQPHPVPPKLILSERVKATAFLSRDQADFADRCRSQGISVRWRTEQNGQLSGVSFSEAGSQVFFSGTRLGIPLSRLNQTLYGNRKTRNLNPRRPDPRLDRGSNPRAGGSIAATATNTGRTPHEFGDTGATIEQKFGDAARSATDADRNTAIHINQKQKITMIKMIKDTLFGIETGLFEALDNIDDTLTPSTPVYRIKQERRLFR